MNDVARQGRTVLLVSHSMPAITALANKGLLLQDGGVCFQGEVHSATQMYLSSRSIEQTRWSRPINEQQSEDQSVRITDLSLTDATGIDWRKKGIRVNCVAPGPIWTPLIPSTMPADHVASFGKNTPLGRAGSRPNWRRLTYCWHRMKLAT